MRVSGGVFSRESTDGLLGRVARTRSLGWAGSLGVGVLCAVVVLALRWATSGLYGSVTGFIILLPGVLIAALATGARGGVTAILLCLFGGWVIAGPGATGVGFADQMGRVATVNFILVGLFCTWVGASLRRTTGRLSASRESFDAADLQRRAMFEQAAAGFVRSDLDGRIVSANGRFCEMLGRPCEDVEGRLATDFTHPDDIGETQALVRDAPHEPGERRMEKRYLRPDGSIVWALLSVRVLHDSAGAPCGFMTVTVDITELKAVEGRLRESESRFRLMADTAPSPVWMTNTDAEVEFVNQALVDFYGKPAEEILGHVWRQVMHPEDEPAVAAVMAQARPAQRPYGFEARFQNAQGQWRWMRIAVNPRTGADGRFLGYVGMSFDVTDTREALDRLEAEERRKSFLLDLSDRLRDETSTAAILDDVQGALGRLWGASRVGYAELDDGGAEATVRRVWTPNGIEQQGRVARIETVSPVLWDEMARGRPVRVADTARDPRTIETPEVWRTAGIGAFIAAPILRAGKLRALMYAHSEGPRDWSDADARLLDEVAARTFAEVERTRAEAELRESEARFRAIADTAPVLIWVTAEDRTRAFINQAYAVFLGGDYEEARLADWRTHIHPDDQAHVLAQSLAGEASAEPFAMEARYLRHDGVYRWLKSFSRPRLDADGRVVGFVGVAFDVTDIREAQARLEESEDRFRTVAESAPALIWMSDDQTRIVFANQRFKTFFQVERNDQLADCWSRMVAEDDQDDFYADFVRAFGRRERFERMTPVEHPELGLRWLRCEGVPRFDGQGRFQGYVGANLDVTETRRAEDDLKRINELLEERVGEALAEKAKAEADLMHAQRMEAVGRLTGGVAHDFNNLLTVVIGALDLMLKSPDNAARQKKLGEAALAAARRGEGLTHQLLAFSRRQALRPEAIDLNQLIRQGEPLLKRGVGDAVDLKLKLKRGGARVNVDPGQFEAALLNLVVNARDAVGDAGQVTVRTEARDVAAGEIPELPAGRYMCVVVQDDGMGMEADVAARVFEPFFTTKAVGRGTGLGLSQVYGFARQSGGGVEVRSIPGEGTSVCICLPPLDPATTATTAAPSSTATTGLAGRKVLLVEDDAGVAAIAVEILEGLGLTVRSAETGRQALERLRRERFDLMLSDVVMPGGMTGIELARAAAAAWPQMRVVLTSGYAGEDVDQALADAPWPFLRKPYSAEQLAEALGDRTVETA